MARRRGDNRNRQTAGQNRRRGRRKSEAEAKAELVTWFLLVMVFGVIFILPEDVNPPNWVVPVSGGLILLGSGIYQYTRGWHISPITWIVGTAMLGIGAYGLYSAPELNLTGFSLIAFAVVIGFGILTGET